MDVESCVNNVVTAAGGVFDAEGEATELAGVYEVHNGEEQAAEASEDGASPSAARVQSQADPYGENPMKRRVFDREQSAILERYYDNGMNSTHRRNKELVDEAAREVGVSADKVKNWIGAETVRRKRQSLAVAGVKTQSATQTPTGAPAAKRKRSLSGYSLFLSDNLKDSPPATIERKTDIATQWRNLSDEERLEWHQRAHLFDPHQTEPSPTATSPVPMTTAAAVTASASPTAAVAPPSSVEGRDRIVSYAVGLLQSCLERLDQVGVHSYCLLVDPIQMKTHTLASALGQQFHQQQQAQQQLAHQDDATATESTDSATTGEDSLPAEGLKNEKGPGEGSSDEAPTSQSEQTPSAETLSVYTAFSRFVLSTALAQPPAATPGSAAGSAGDSSQLGGSPGALVSPTGNACRYQTADGYICPYVATSPHFLRAHRLDTGHSAKRGRPRKNLAAMPALSANSSLILPNLDAVASLSTTTTSMSAAINTTCVPPVVEPLPAAEVTVGTETADSGADQDVSDLSIDHMIMLVRNTFNTKYEAATNLKTIPFDDIRALENIVVYGLPDGITLQRPRTYTLEQLRAIVKELDRVLFLPITKSTSQTTVAPTTVSTETIINTFVTAVDSLMTDTVPLNVVIESTPQES